MTATGRILLAAVLLAFAAVAAAAFLLLGTAGGANFLISVASRGAPVRIEVGRVSGRLADDLRLESIEVRWPSGEAFVESLHLRWHPLSLLGGSISISTLSVDGAKVSLHPKGVEETSAPLSGLRWPSVTGLPARLDGSIDSLRLSELAVRFPGREPAVFTGTTARVDWKDGVLSVSGFAVEALAGTVTGSLAAGFIQPSLEADLEFLGVDISRAVDTDRSDISGALRVEGIPPNYHGSFSVQNRGEGIRSLRLAGAFSGDIHGIAFSRISGSWLDGALEGEGEASWKDGIALAGRMAGRDLDPARIRPDWPGRINFGIKGAAKATGESPFAAYIEGRLLSSTLRNRPLTGEIRARLDREGFVIGRLGLHGDGFDVTAGGRLRERLDLSADIREVGGLLPGAEGSAKIAGWIRWRDRSPEGSISADATRLRVSRIRLDYFSLSGRHEGKGGRLAIDARGRGFSRGALRIDSFSLDVSGTHARHAARLNIRAGSGRAGVSAKGGYREGWWEGMVTGLSILEKDIGEWTLAAPFRLAASTGKVRVSPFVLTGPGGGSAGASAELATLPLRGTLRGEWNMLDPGIINPWIAGVRLSGNSSGEAEIRLSGSGRAAFSLRADASGKFLAGEREYAVGGAEAVLSWDRDGLSSRWEVDLAGRGTLRGSVSSDEPGRLGLPSRGEAHAEWMSLDLRLLSAGFTDARIAGTSSGTLAARWREGGRLEISGNADLSGSIARGDLELGVPRARAVLEGNGSGIRASLELVLAGGGAVKGDFRSDRPARIGIPGEGKVRLAFESLDLALISPWIPKGLRVEGALGGSAAGELVPGGKFVLEGEARIAPGRLKWQSKGGEAAATLRSADLRFAWRGEAAVGEIAILLEDYGSLRGNFRIPLPARLPPAIRSEERVEAALSANFREKGLLSAFFPGWIQESTGEGDLDMKVGGTWDSPVVEGKATLSHAGAYLPAAGISVEEIELRAVLAGATLRVEIIKALSGEGSLAGSAIVRLENWRIAGYEASLEGNDFLALDLPEVRLVVSPDLAIEGMRRRLKVRGGIRVPEMQIRGRQKHPPIPRSEDVIIVDAEKPSAEESPLSIDVSVEVVLGKHVLVKAQGVDARLEGGFTLIGDRKGRMIARGEVRVAEGRYAVYGIRLKIARGSLFFVGTPIEQPTLDFLAIRSVGEVKAGVEVAGTLNRPVVKLYSVPSMEDTDILSYIVLGRPLGQQKEQVEPLMLAAGALLPFGQSAMLQDRLKRRLGFDVLEVKTAGEEATESVVTIGKYLNPRLYVSYGRSIFAGTDEFIVRYDFRKRFQVESQIGDETGVDLFYKIEFR